MAIFTPSEIQRCLRNLRKQVGKEQHTLVPSPSGSHSSAKARGGRAVLAAGLVLSFTALTACAQTGANPSSAPASTLDKIKQSKKVSVGISDERPYGYLEGGKLVGQAPALSGYIFDQIGEDIQLEPKLMEFGSLIQSLNANGVDVVTAGMYITPARCKQADFGNVEYVAGTAFVVKKGNPLGLKDYASVAANGQARLAVLNGSVHTGQAKANGIPEASLQVVADAQGGLDAVKAGRADAYASTGPAARAQVKGDPDVEVLDSFVPVVDGKEQVGVSGAVFRKGDDALREAYNAELKKLIESGKWLELLEPYGFTKAEMPDPSMTAEKYCQE